MSILDEKIKKANSISIMGHINPDGDCLGSTLALYNYILNIDNKKIVKVYLMEAQNKFNILSGFDKICHDYIDNFDYDLGIICDCSTEDRVKDYYKYFKTAKDKLIIDHHVTSTDLQYDNIINPQSAATCELLYDLLDDKYIDKKVAECLYVGLSHDSGVFRYNNTTVKTLEVAINLIKKNIDFTYLLDKTLFSEKFNQKLLLAKVYERAKFLCKGKVIFSYIHMREVNDLNLEKGDIDLCVPNLRQTDNVDLALFVYDVAENVYKVSMRSNTDKIDCAMFSKNHKGGGHKRAAGFTLNMKIENIPNYLENELKGFFNE